MKKNFWSLGTKTENPIEPAGADEPEVTDNPVEADETDETKDPEESAESETVAGLRAEIERLKAAVIEARREGEIAGRNARIEEILESDDSDGLPPMDPSPAPASRADSIFSLAAGAR